MTNMATSCPTEICHSAQILVVPCNYGKSLNPFKYHLDVLGARGGCFQELSQGVSFPFGKIAMEGEYRLKSPVTSHQQHLISTYLLDWKSMFS